MSGQIHDLGYKRYVGTRRPPSTRWRVIARHQIATAWKSWWRWKAAVGFAVVNTFVWFGIMYVPNRAFRGFGKVGGAVLSFTDAALPMSIQWYCRIAFYLTLTVGAAAIAGDVQSGAFTFYFARSVRPRDYVIGKLVGFALPIACLLVAAPFVLALIRLGMYEDLDEAFDHIAIVPKVLAVGALATLAYATVPLAFSALVPNRRTALALWAAYYLVFGSIMQAIGFFSNGSIAAVDLPTAVQTVALDVFDIHALWGRSVRWGGHTAVAIGSLVAHAAAAIAIVWYQVGRAERSGIGGAS